MAAVVEPNGGLDLNKFALAVKRELPSYATPMFIRIVEKLDITGKIVTEVLLVCCCCLRYC